MNNNKNGVPFLDLVTPNVELEEELVAMFGGALRTAGFIGGPMVEGLERDFAEFCETPHCVGVASGTDALRFALIAAGVQPGDTVVTVPNTFIATTEAISQAGASFDFVDVNEQTYTMDPEKLRSYFISRCTRNASGRAVSIRTGRPVTAVVPVHLYGQMADMDPILEIATEFDLLVVEDACQAHGAEYFSRREQRWFKAGSMGDAAGFSFYPGKNLGALGEAGAITCANERTAQVCRMLREHGQAKKYHHDMEGYNGRLDAIQAGALQIKLRHLANWNRQRQQAAQRYAELFGEATGLVLPHVPKWSRPVHHLYVIRVAKREALQNHLSKAGIGSGIHYPIPLHVSPAYAPQRFRQGDFPVTERAAAEILSLPMFPNLFAESQHQVVAEVRRFLSESSETEQTLETQSA
jgi:dTDP-4-amino-4,6-dideoxygalactose transaminase